MHSCNWTMMDLKMKMLLVFAMRMEDANKMMIKITPKKNINLRLFCRVSIDNSYNTKYIIYIRKNKCNCLFLGNVDVLQYCFFHVELEFE